MDLDSGRVAGTSKRPEISAPVEPAEDIDSDDFRVRSLLFSTLYPSAARPLHGLFVETRLRELIKTGYVVANVVAPVPWFPFSGNRWGERARFSRTPVREHRHGLDLRHPRYALLPKVGMSIAPLLLALGSLATMWRLRREFDLIDAHYYYPDGVAAVLLGSWLRKPVVVTARGSDINLISRHVLPRWQLRWAARRARASIGVSAALVERMRALGFDGGRLHVVRNGVDLQRFAPVAPAAARAELGLTGSPLLLTVGNVHEHKGQGLAIEALATLLRMPGHGDARLLVVGAGPDRAKFEALAARLGVADRVTWAGTIDNAELKRWYSAADVLVLASSREGWPNVLLESMACGTPVVATDVGGVSEIVRAPVAGRVVSPRTPQALAAAICDLLDHSPPRDAVRAYAAAYDWDRTSQDQLRIFRHVLRHTH